MAYFEQSFVTSRTPYRISFFGGGSDYPNWYLNEEGGGAVISTSIDKYCFISARYLPPFFNVKHRIVWSHIESVNNISEILHPAVREGLRFLGFDDTFGVEIHHQGDLPARSGVGSSSAFAVGLIKAMMGLRNEDIDKHSLALKAIDLEQNWLKDSVGSQDQVASAYGGLNVIRFAGNGQIKVEPVGMAPERQKELDENLMLFFTGTSRMGGELAAKIIANMDTKRNHIFKMRDLVDQATKILKRDSSIDDFGHLLHETWMLKRELADQVTNTTIDMIYNIARQAGALGGKLLGAGSSGFMLFYVPKEFQPIVASALSRYLHVPFEFETKGSVLLDHQERT